MAKNTKRLVVSLPIEQHQYILDTARGNQSFVVKEAIECYRLFNGSLAQAQEAATALAEMCRLFGRDWQAGVKQFEEAVKKV